MRFRHSTLSTVVLVACVTSCFDAATEKRRKTSAATPAPESAAEILDLWKDHPRAGSLTTLLAADGAAAGHMTLPEGGLTVEEPCVVSRPLVIDGRHRVLDFRAEGRLEIRLRPGEVFTLQNTVILWRRFEAPAGSPPLLQLCGGNLRLEGNEIYADHRPKQRPHESAISTSSAPPPGWIVKVGLTRISSEHVLELRANRFVGLAWYGVGALHAGMHARLKDSVVQANRFENLHGGIYALNTQRIEINRNEFSRVSFGNIVIGGQKATVKGNRLLYPGNGTAGDGVTVFDLQYGLLEDNWIFHGSCVGIWCKGDVNDLIIRRNSILEGLTTAIRLAAPAGSETRLRDIQVSRNVIAGNLGRALVAEAVDGLVVSRNVFQENRPTKPSQHRLIRVKRLTWEGNLRSRKFTKKDAETLHPFGTHVVPYPVE